MAQAMADPILELIAPHLGTGHRQLPDPDDAASKAYIARLTTLRLQSLSSSEYDAIKQSAQSILRSIQSLSKRSYRSIIAADDHLGSLSRELPRLTAHVKALGSVLPDTDTAAKAFAAKYENSRESAVLEQRKRLTQLNGSVDRVGNILELPALLSSIVSSSTLVSASASSAHSASSTSATGYASALDIHAQVKRLVGLYPNSRLVQEISVQSGQELQTLATILINSLDSPNLKLAAAMRAIGWLRRIAPDLDKQDQHLDASDGPEGTRNNLADTIDGTDESLGALFLVCRLGTMRRTISALDPLKELADAETTRRRQQQQHQGSAQTTEGTQTERYLKRYIEIFREHSFAIISTYKSIFPSALPAPSGETASDEQQGQSQGIAAKGSRDKYPGTSALEQQQSALATFVPYLSGTLFDTLQTYVPNVVDRSARESLLTQVLYCAASLGRLGADFGMMLALMEEDISGDSAPGSGSVSGADGNRQMEWVHVQKKQRAQASRLESLASGVSSGRKASDSPQVGA